MAYFKQVWFCGGGKMLVRRYIHIWHPENISLGSNLHIFNNCQIATHPNKAHPHPELRIGDNCEIGEQTHITCANKIIIGDNLLTGRRCTITDNSHGDSERYCLDINPRHRDIKSKGSIHIGNNVWLGDNVVVLPGVSIGDGVIVGANAVITKDIPPYSVAVGNPTKVKKTVQ